jgi:lipid II:glycine glycyltransferase (peptidoglycan interpeptide bridge formation enzyme)
VTVAETVDDLKIFYKLYFMTRKKVGLPPHPYRFFNAMWHVLKPADMLFILIAWFSERPIAAILCMKHHGRVHYEYIGVDYEYMRVNPNIFLLWNAIKLSHEEKNRFFEFGSSDIHNTGLIQFKQRWGTVAEELHHFYYPEIRGISSKTSTSVRYQLLSMMVRHMPNWLLDQAGHFCYRHAGG